MKTNRASTRWMREPRRRSGPFLTTKKRFAVSTAASSDDANEVTGTTVVSIIGTTIGFQADRTGGFRFDNITIPAEANILAASIQFTSSSTISGDGTAACIVNIWGDASDDAAAFAAANADVSGRTPTTATVAWIFPPSTGENAWVSGARGPLQRTPNLRSIVQEIVDRAGWVSGQAMAFIFDHDGNGLGSRQVAAHDHASLTEPSLTIIWSA